jgi:amidophosphoribosyltransferase
MPADKPREECGVFGVWGHPEASKLTYLGLYALQHRGQESAGIVAACDGRFTAYRGMGLVADVFDEPTLDHLAGDIAIGHNRYSTTGMSVIENAQPFSVVYAHGSLAVAHNGNLVNGAGLRDDLQSRGAIFQTTSDTEVIVHLISWSRKNEFSEAVIDALAKVRGAFCVLLTNGRELVVARDTCGLRPLCMGELSDAYVFASESCAFDIIDAEFEREVEPGEVIVVNSDGMRSCFPFEKTRLAHCVFEFVYFCRPDSLAFGEQVNTVRENLGKELARESPADVDAVIAVPDSSNPAAVGYARELGKPFELGLIRNHYVGRTFIEPEASIRDFGAKIKYNPVREALRGKRVVAVDDSIVRGNTSKKIVTMLRKAGAAEIHFRVGSAPYKHPCYYGIDVATYGELAAAPKSVEAMREFIGADTLRYLSVEGMVRATGKTADQFCLGCFTGDYPTRVPQTDEQCAAKGCSDGRRTTLQRRRC